MFVRRTDAAASARARLSRGTPPAAWPSETGRWTRGAGGRHQAPAEGKETGVGKPQDTQETRAKRVGRSSSQGSEKEPQYRSVRVGCRALGTELEGAFETPFIRGARAVIHPEEGRSPDPWISSWPWWGTGTGVERRGAEMAPPLCSLHLWASARRRWLCSGTFLQQCRVSGPRPRTGETWQRPRT